MLFNLNLIFIQNRRYLASSPGSISLIHLKNLQRALELEVKDELMFGFNALF